MQFMDAHNITRGEKKRLKGKVSASVQEHAGMGTPKAGNAALIAELTEVISTLMDDKLKIVQLWWNKTNRDLNRQKIGYRPWKTLKILQTKVAEMETQLKTANDKVIDLESRSHRDNLKILNLKEGIEGTDPKIFLETMLPKLPD